MSRAYYNEFNPFAAQWLRNLIDAGAIAPGDVDERSIEDVRPTDLLGYTQCHFFAGIKPTPTPMVNSSFCREACGKSGTKPRPSLATACSQRNDADPIAHVVACEQFLLLGFHRRLDMPSGPLGLDDRTAHAGCLEVVSPWSLRGISAPLPDDVHGTSAQTSHYSRADNHRSIAICCAGRAQSENVSRTSGNYDRVRGLGAVLSCGDVPCISQSNTFCDSETPAIPRRTLHTLGEDFPCDKNTIY